MPWLRQSWCWTNRWWMRCGGKDANPVGETLRMVQMDVPQLFTVIGVMNKRPGVIGISNRAVLVPLHTAQMRMTTDSRNTISYIAARVDERDSLRRQTAVAEINTILRARRAIPLARPRIFRCRILCNGARRACASSARSPWSSRPLPASL